MDLPATVCLPLVEEAVMQSAITTLPELNTAGYDSPAPPVGRSRYLPPYEAEALRSKAHHDVFARGYVLTLWGDTCPYPTLVGTHGEVGIALLRA